MVCPGDFKNETMCGGEWSNSVMSTGLGRDYTTLSHITSHYITFNTLLYIKLCHIGLVTN